MSWARYDDEFPMNKKVGRLVGRGQIGLAAIGLHLLANTYARHNGTAGVIEAHVPNLLCGTQGRKLAKLLQDVGMFDEHLDGWVIHDFAEFNDPNDPEPNKSAAERKKELSEKRAAAGRKGGLANGKQKGSKASDLLEANDQAKGKQSSSPVPGPVPSCTTGSKGSSSSHRETDDDETVDNYELVAGHLAKLKTDAAKPESPKRYMAAVRKNIDAEDGDEIRRLLDGFPTAPVTVVAAAVLTGDTRHLAPYA